MLTAKQERFCQAVIAGATYADAYRSAYDTSKMADKTVHERASVLAGQSKITARILELRDKISRDNIMTAQRRREWLTEVINNEDIDINARLKASDQLNRMDGEYVQKVEAEVVKEVTINVELVDE